MTVSTLAKDLSILDVLCYVISWNCRLFHVYCFKYIHFMYIVWKSAMPCVIMPYGHVKVFLLIFCWWKYSKHTRGEWKCLRWWMFTLMIVYVDDCLRGWLFTFMIVYVYDYLRWWLLHRHVKIFFSGLKITFLFIFSVFNNLLFPSIRKTPSYEGVLYMRCKSCAFHGRDDKRNSVVTVFI